MLENLNRFLDSTNTIIRFNIESGQSKAIDLLSLFFRRINIQFNREGGYIMRDLILSMYEDENLTIGEIASAYQLEPSYVYDVIYHSR